MAFVKLGHNQDDDEGSHFKEDSVNVQEPGLEGL